MVSLESAKSHDLLNSQFKLSDENPSIANGTSYSTQDSGERKLAALGYSQELNRGFNTFTNFAVSFSIISLLTGITGVPLVLHLGILAHTLHVDMFHLCPEHDCPGCKSYLHFEHVIPMCHFIS